ncbi:AAA family ATPase [Pseudomonas sp. HR96]|uniref:trifunctional serine/threonine-protein kinase/ATP-binding protein/sensor histidine kinase n=1 Tax=Pseudomonas sp. HR96 TaxID=1027966 RepID=UPI002A74C4DA|nr:AAA family ATPase [Pseudomonas sp. HR96]WPP01577.1 AAA family ATPase [Pseudomonas sp. HR96]
MNPIAVAPVLNRRETGHFNEQWLQQLQWQLLRVDGEVAWYRVRSPNALRPWVIVRPTGSATEDVFRRLQHEYQLREALDPAWAVVPTALLYSAEGPLLVLDEPGGRGLEDTQGDQLSISLFLQLAFGAAQALAGLHGQGVLHRDLKPCQFIEGEDGVVRLAGFALSSRQDVRAPRSQVPACATGGHDPASAAVISGSLAYMSPEQAGRVEGAADGRSDLYSLGVTLYELLTGRLPFVANDAVEWLHQHLAQPPLPPEQLRGDVPPALSAIILRLLAKDPAQRYASASALAQVLRRALVQWRETGELAADAGAAESDPTRALTAHWAPVLVGRESEMARLHACVRRLSEQGEPGPILVSGPYGSGKTLLLRQLHQDLAASALRFAACRFDPGRQAMPYAAVCAALRGLLLQVLGERPTVLQRWRQRLQRALGGRAHWMVAMLPEIEWVLGPLRAPATGDDPAGQGPLDELLLDCLAVFARPQKPLLLFFDDLQWLDPQSLDFFNLLATRRLAHLLLIGAYRERPGRAAPEEFASAAQAAALQRLLAGAGHQAGVAIKLAPLRHDTVQALLASQLRWQAPALAELATLLMAKSGGNPLFVQQLLCGLIDDGLLRHVPAASEPAHWQWETERLAEYPVAPDVLEQLLSHLGRLPGVTRRLLGLLALVGSRADGQCIARLAERSLDDLRQDLHPALAAGLLTADRQGWRFSHERLREAAYRLVPAAQRSKIHTRIARVLIADLLAADAASAELTLPWVPLPSPSANDSRVLLFRIALHIQQAARDPVLEADRTAFIQVLLQAAQRARDTAALPFALEYLRLARELGSRQRWLEHRGQCLAVERLYIHCLIQAGDHEPAQAAISQLLERVDSLQERAMLHVLQVHSRSLAGDYAAAVSAGLEGLGLFGLAFADLDAHGADAANALARVEQLLDQRPVAALIELPENRDPRIDAAHELLACLLAPATFSQPGLSWRLVCKMVELTLMHGLAPASARGLAWFGVMLAQHSGDYQQGLRFADLGQRIVARMPIPAHQASVLLALARVSVWIRPLDFAAECAERAVAAGRNEGVPYISCHAHHQWACLLLGQGVPLLRVQEQAEAGLALAGLPGTGDGQLLLHSLVHFVQRLRGLPTTHASQARPAAQANMAAARFWWWLFEAIEAFHQGAHEVSLQSLDRAQALAWSVPGHLHQQDLALYRALNLSALAPAEDREPTLAALAEPLAQLRHWAELNPAVCLDQCLLVEAEAARLAGQPLRALGLYEAAIAQAGSTGSASLQALGHELAARCNQQLGLVTAARSHWRQAREQYQRWGAQAKVRALEAQHQCLHDQPGDARSSVDLRQGQHYLDLISVTKASQALSREVVLDRLIETLMANTVMHAGAQRGALVLLHKGEPLVVARGQTWEGGVQVELARVPLDQAQLPMEVVYRVLRSGQWLALNDADQVQGQGDGLLHVPTAGSMLCLPLLKQGEVSGLIYLENPLARGLFSEARIAVLEVLAAQAAISLETSSLYAELLEENQRRRDAEVQLRNARAELAQANQATLMGELAASIAHEINQPLVAIVANASASVRWLKRATPQVEEALEGLHDIVGDGRRAADIVVALQALAKQRAPNRSRLIIDDVVRQVLRLAASDIEHRHVQVDSRLDTAGSRVFVDGVLMQQVVYNLVINALDAMAGIDEGRRRLTLTSSVQAGQVVVSVEDTGNGIDAAHLPKVFDAFFTTKPGGMGMGLAICRSIMIAQGGTLHLTHGRAGQTMFVFTLPLLPATCL